MKLCYFGIYDPDFGRNKVYISGLRAFGHEVIECRDSSPGFLKYGRLKRKHDAILRAGGYDAMIVGYPGHLVVPLAKRLAVHAQRVLGGSRRPVIFDALCTLYEGEVLSRGKYSANPFMRWRINYIDEKAVEAADHILVETEAQKRFFVKRFRLDPAKLSRVFTGCDESVFKPHPHAKKRDTFTAVFRGKFLPEAGVRHVIEAAKALEGSGVNVLILGHGFLEPEVRAQIEHLAPTNLEWLSDKPALSELARRMSECHVALGQFEQHDRLQRTIPHKAFEALALGLPYVTARTAGISELLTDSKDCLMVEPGSPGDIAQKILALKDDPALRERIAKSGHETFMIQASERVLASKIIDAIRRSA
jgi:glycosyltransferase involved in cell wall biosynthesis